MKHNFGGFLYKLGMSLIDVRVRFSNGLWVNYVSWCIIRDWSLITGRGATKQKEGQVNFYPYIKGGRKSFSHAEEGHKKF